VGMRALFPDVESQVGAGALTHIKSASYDRTVRTDRNDRTNEQMPIRIRKLQSPLHRLSKWGAAVLLVALMCAHASRAPTLPLAQRSTRRASEKPKQVGSSTRPNNS